MIFVLIINDQPVLNTVSVLLLSFSTYCVFDILCQNVSDGISYLHINMQRLVT